jgi:hypothetical protein
MGSRCDERATSPVCGDVHPSLLAVQQGCRICCEGKIEVTIGVEGIGVTSSAGQKFPSTRKWN